RNSAHGEEAVNGAICLVQLLGARQPIQGQNGSSVDVASMSVLFPASGPQRLITACHNECQVLTSGRLLVEKDRDGEFSGRGRKRIAVAHGRRARRRCVQDPDRLPMCAKSRCSKAIAESRTAVVSEQVLLRPRATVPPSQ